ncbi:hypothetical protein [Pseudomonas sp. RIT-PI-o]|uniref:hypothetical protein n=1 Tax=Pseudomonas sp. RIT-PI-o TaxID=1690246 RepID=UPI0006CC216C|nr:hypothetical protein [Pseudomonas sp. RIT-PI-o]KPG82208.1 hypothetical protein AEQ63_13465 [Pseudomonas sp. RIT-PI-o]
MTIIEQLAAKGFELVTGHRRLVAALETGASVQAVDQAGVHRTLQVVKGELVVSPVLQQKAAMSVSQPFYAPKINVRGH